MYPARQAEREQTRSGKPQEISVDISVDFIKFRHKSAETACA
jgi:hypothetical protein